MTFDDQLGMEGCVPATFRSTRTAGNVDVSLGNAIPYPVTIREQAASGGRYQAGDVTWSLRTAELGTVQPKPADLIIDEAGARWTILEATPAAFASFVRAVCRNLAIAYDLRDAIDIYRPDPTQEDDAAGNREPSFLPLSLGAICRVQETARRTVDTLGKLSAEVDYVVYLEQQIALTHEDQIRWNGKVLEIIGSVDPDRIDVLQRIDCIWRGF